MASSSNKRMGSEEDLPEKLKQFKPSDDRVERKKIENLLNETRSMLEEERVERLASLSQAEWIPSIKLAKVTKQVGKQWNTMGHSFLGDMVLYPEEALFLLETNAIEISFGGMPMSLQQAYSVLLGVNSTCTLEEYRVYSHLTKYGYKLRRHGCEPVPLRAYGDEPPEIDVVGVICKRKSSENVSSEKAIDEEKSVKEAKEGISHKWSCEQRSSIRDSQPLPPGVDRYDDVDDDDDVEFIEFIDASKKRKVCDTIVIGDDVEILPSSAIKGSHSPSQNEKSSNSKINNGDSGSEIQKLVSNHESTDVKSSSVEESAEFSAKPFRALYKSEPFPTLKEDEEASECVSSSNTSGRPNDSISKEVDVQNNIPSANKVSKERSDDVIEILSDDESNVDDKHKVELQKFYQEISLLEVIDISQDDEEKKASSSRACDRRDEDNYDFWGVLGRIPVMMNGKLAIIIPAPPSDLIPSNTSPIRDEYTINMRVISEKPIEVSRDSSRVRDGQYGKRKSYHHGGSHSSLPRSSRHQTYFPPSLYQEMQQYRSTWGPWNAQYSHSNGFDPSLPSTSSQCFFGRQYPQPSWLSCVYSHRPYNNSFDHFPARNSNHSSYHSRDYNRPYSQRRESCRPIENATEEVEDGYRSVVLLNPNATNWSEMKRSEMKQECVVTTEEASASAKDLTNQSIPTEEISPLLKPSDSVDIDAVLSKIQVTTSAKRTSVTSAESTSSLSIKYDLYMPNSIFRKSCPGAPRYRLSVVNSNDGIPKLSDISHLRNNAGDDVPILFAVGFPETINFFSFSNVDLPIPLKKES